MGAAPALELEEAAAVEPPEVAVPVAEAVPEALAELVVEEEELASLGSRVPQWSLMLVVQLDWPCWSFSFSLMQSLYACWQTN